jgi:hypothetical protein
MLTSLAFGSRVCRCARHPEKRESHALIRTVTHLTDCRDWLFSWDPRGLRRTHDVHRFALGIPAAFAGFLQDAPAK